MRKVPKRIGFQESVQNVQSLIIDPTNEMNEPILRRVTSLYLAYRPIQHCIKRIIVTVKHMLHILTQRVELRL